MERVLEPDIDFSFDYIKYRGKCKEISEAAVANDSSLRLVRGFYICPYWGKQTHWWTVRDDDTIYDPTALQFPSHGNGEYIEFNGITTCELCGEDQVEEETYFIGSHTYCSYECYASEIM